MTRAAHSLKRAKERYGLDLVLDDLMKIAEDIQENRGTLIKIMPDKVTVWAIEVKGVLCKVVISADFHRVITFLPPYAFSIRDEKGRTVQPGKSRRYIERKRDHRYRGDE